MARPQKEGRHSVSKVSRVVSMKIIIKDSKICNILAMRKRLTVSRKRDNDNT